MAKEYKAPQHAQLPYDKQPAFAPLQAQHRPTAPRPSSPSWPSSPPVRAGAGSSGSSPLPATDGGASELRRIRSRTATNGNLGGRVHMCGAGKGIWVRVRAGGSKPLPELEHGPRQGRFLEGPALRPPPPGLLQGNKSSHLTGFDARDHGFGTLSIPARIFIKIYIGAFRILLGACGSPLPERQKMAAMGALMAAATNADPAVVEAAGMEEPASKKAKGRGNAVDAAAAKVKSAQLALDVHQATVAAVEAMGSTAKQADRRKAERAKAQISKRKAELIGLVAGLEAKKAKAEATAARAAAQVSFGSTDIDGARCPTSPS